MTRNEVLKIAQREHKELGRVVSEVPSGWNWGETGIEPDGRVIFYFGVYWNTAPNTLCVLAYGPHCTLDPDGIEYDESRYVCYAS